MKKIITLLVALCVIMSCSLFSAFAAETSDISISLQIDNPIMTVNGTETEVDEGRETAPVIRNSRTLMPVRTVVEEMGGSVAWDNSSRTAVLTLGENEIRLIIDSTTAYFNNEAAALDTAPIIINDRTFLPIRFIAESFGFIVEWDETNSTVTIIKQTNIQQPDMDETGSAGAALVVYFSMPETTEPDNMTEEEANSTVVIDGQVLGNTQYVAYVIQERIGADIFRIEPETPYTTDHETLVDLAAEEQENSARPAIKDSIENFEQYDTVFVGYPNWWGDMPMILYTFFDEYDFSGKTVIPFNTHGGSGFSSTISTIAELEPNANVNRDGFTVSRNNVQDAEEDIVSWVEGLGY